MRDILEAMMTTYHPPRVSAFAKRHYGEGITEGERHTIRTVLKARNLSLTDCQSNEASRPVRRRACREDKP